MPPLCVKTKNEAQTSPLSIGKGLFGVLSVMGMMGNTLTPCCAGVFSLSPFSALMQQVQIPHDFV